MENLFRTFRLLLNNTTTDFIRYLHDQISWNSRLVAILGARGVGKTTLLLQHIKLHDNVKEDNRLLGDLSLCSRPHFAALRLLYLTLQATVQVAYLIINIIELQFSPCTFLLPARGIFIPFPGFSRHDTPFTNHFLSSFCLFFVGFPCFLLRKCIAIPLFHYATFCFRISDLLNISVSGNSSKTVRLVIVVCT